MRLWQILCRWLKKETTEAVRPPGCRAAALRMPHKMRVQWYTSGFQ